VENNSNELEHHILTFSRLHNAQKSTASEEDIFANVLSLSFLHTSHDAETREEELVQLNESIVHLTKYLNNGEDGEGDVSKVHIASLLFPYISTSISSKLDRAGYDTWNCLYSCMTTLLRGKCGGNSNVLSDIVKETSGELKVDKRRGTGVDVQAQDAISNLTQGSMNKWMQCMIRVCFGIKYSSKPSAVNEGNTEEQAKIQNMAATCYALIITSEFCRPTMDFVCKTLLPLVEQGVQSISTGMDICVKSHQSVIAYLSLHLLLSLQGKGRITNPKTIFSLASSSDFLRALSTLNQISTHDEVDVKSVVKQVIWYALYDVQHHMDGFRSMNLDVPLLDKTIQVQDEDTDTAPKGNKVKKGKGGVKAAYQQSLLTSIKSLMQPKKSKDTVHVRVASLLPLLIEGFMSQLLQYENDAASKNVSRRADIIARIQFRFWSHIVHPLLECVRDESEGRVEILASLHQCLGLLLKFDAYMPSFEDKGGDHLKYLLAIGEAMLHLEEGDKGGDELVGIFQHLFALNHHVYHENLSRLITCVVHIHIGSTGARTSNGYPSTRSSQFISSMTKTYQKLRQLGHFIKNIIGSMTDLNTNTNLARKTMKTNTNIKTFPFLREAAFQKSITVAIRSSPIGQITDIWTRMNDQIMKSFESMGMESGKGTNLDSNSIRVLVQVVEFFVLFLKAVHVTSFNAKSIQESCEKSMGIVQKLVGADADATMRFDLVCTTTSSGLYLWGWMVNVNTKCSFWLNEMPHEENGSAEGEDDKGNDHGKEKDDKIGIIGGRKMFTFLLATIESVLASPDDLKLPLGALQHLACHRVQQLHSSIYQQEQLEKMDLGNDDDSGDDNGASVKMIEEAKLLVHFIFQSACHRKQEGESNCLTSVMVNRTAGWKVICGSLAILTPYASSQHIQSFLRWFFLIQSVDIDKGRVDGVGLSGTVHVPVLEEDILTTSVQDEKAAASLLLQDASFLEYRVIFEHIVPVGLLCASECLQVDSLSNDSHGEDNIFKVLKEESPKEIGEAKFDLVKEVIVILKILRILVGADFKIEELSITLHRILYIHKSCQKWIHAHMVKASSSTLYPDIVKLMFACEELMSDTFGRLQDNNLKYMNQGKSIILHLVPYLYHSTEDLLRCIEQSSDDSLAILGDETVRSASKLLAAIGIFGMSSFAECSTHIEAFGKAVRKQIKGLTLKEPFFHNCVVLVRPTVQLFSNYLESIRRTQTKISKSQKALISVIEKELAYLRETIQPLCIDYIHQSLPTSSFNSTLGDCMLFLADIQMSSTKENDKTTLKHLEKILDTIMNLLENPEDVSSSIDHLPLPYLFSSLIRKNAMNDQSLELKLRVQHIILQQYVRRRGQIHPLLDSAYSRVIRDMNPTDVSILGSDLLASVMKADVDSSFFSRSSAFYCFHMMCHVVKGQSQREVMSSIAERILPMAYNFVYPPVTSQNSYDEWLTQIIMVQGTMRTLIEKNDLIHLRGCDVANILATINAVFRQSEPLKNDINISRCIFTSSCKIVVNLLKQYPKHLYGCAPSLTSTLRCLLKHIMTSSLPNLETQEFTKVCKFLPKHKDMFKKHLMHLILFFINNLQASTDPSLKAQLEPSIFLLLDTLSDFETRQMNTMMDPTARALFQSVHKNYQKYQYKGQF